MTGWTKAWIAWGSASALSFAAIESKALRVEHATLSEHLRTVFGFDDSGPYPHLRRTTFYVTWGWFGLHILRKTAGCVSCAVPSIPSL
jgi:hypothetical protein